MNKTQNINALLSLLEQKDAKIKQEQVDHQAAEERAATQITKLAENNAILARTNSRLCQQIELLRSENEKIEHLAAGQQAVAKAKETGLINEISGLKALVKESLAQRNALHEQVKAKDEVVRYLEWRLLQAQQFVEKQGISTPEYRGPLDAAFSQAARAAAGQHPEDSFKVLSDSPPSTSHSTQESGGPLPPFARHSATASPFRAENDLQDSNKENIDRGSLPPRYRIITPQSASSSLTTNFDPLAQNGSDDDYLAPIEQLQRQQQPEEEEESLYHIETVPELLYPTNEDNREDHTTTTDNDQINLTMPLPLIPNNNNANNNTNMKEIEDKDIDDDDVHTPPPLGSPAHSIDDKDRDTNVSRSPTTKHRPNRSSSAATTTTTDTPLYLRSSSRVRQTVSYILPSINSKLRQGDPFTFGDPSSLPRSKKKMPGSKTKARARHTLRPLSTGSKDCISTGNGDDGIVPGASSGSSARTTTALHVQQQGRSVYPANGDE